MIRFPALLLLSLVSTSPLLARQIVVFPTDRVGPADEEDAGTPAPFGAAAVGDFDGDCIADAFILRGETLLYVNDLVNDGNATVIGSGYNDLALLKNVQPGRDACVTVGGAGLELWYFDEVVAFSQSNNTAGIKSVLLAAGNWIDAVAVKCGRLDAGVADDIVGIKDGRLHLLAVTTTGATTVSSTQSISLGNPASSIALVDFDAIGTKRVAVADQTGVTLYSPLATTPAGSAVSSLAAHPYPAMASYRIPGSGERLVAMTQLFPLEGQDVYVVSQTTPLASAWFAPAFDAVSIEPFDADLDGDMDLAMNCRGTGEIGILLQDASQPTPFDA